MFSGFLFSICVLPLVILHTFLASTIPWILCLSVNSPVRVSLLSFRHVKYPMDIAQASQTQTLQNSTLKSCSPSTFHFSANTTVSPTHLSNPRIWTLALTTPSLTYSITSNSISKTCLFWVLNKSPQTWPLPSLTAAPALVQATSISTWIIARAF